MKYNLFIGRWAPFHNGHKYIIDSFVNNGKPVCIAIRDTELDPKNPFSAKSRKKIIEKVYECNDNVKVTIIPDIETVAVGRDVGYSLIEVPEEIKTISATKIRTGKKDDLPEKIKGMLLNGHVIWFTGLPCSGKTTLADKLKDLINDCNEDILVERLDGDIVRKSICKDLGFSKEDRTENLRRVAEISKTLAENGALVLSTFITPYEETREMIKNIIGPNNFTLIYLDAPLKVCEKRDTKGMWAKARAGEIKDFTGVDDVFEEPKMPYFYVDSSGETSISDNVSLVFQYLTKKNIIW
jgi:adenylylsulfate kinase